MGRCFKRKKRTRFVALIHVVVIPVREDNYSYLLFDEETKAGAVVDPFDPKIVSDAIKNHNVKLNMILTTHHHNDHAGGNEEMLRLFPGVTCFGGDDRVPGMNKKVRDGDVVELGNIKITCYHTPCHTSGHVLYVANLEGEDPLLFSGDTLFIAGCGRFFEGNAGQMVHALLGVVANLPHNTKVYCGHEYTVNNLLFAQTVEPSNPEIQKKLDWARAKRNEGAPTVPSTVGQELTYNPFMRLHSQEIKTSVGTPNDDDETTMKLLRESKDKWKPPKL